MNNNKKKKNFAVPPFIKIIKAKKYFYCEYCNCEYCYNYDNKKISRHFENNIHLNNCKRLQLQEVLTQNYCNDLIVMISKLSLPISILNNEEFMKFLHKYTKFDTPYKCDIYRNDYIRIITLEILQEIRNELIRKEISIYNDNTKDIINKNFTNIYIYKKNQ